MQGLFGDCWAPRYGFHDAENACQVQDACQATHLVSDLDRFAGVVAWVVTYIA